MKKYIEFFSFLLFWRKKSTYLLEGMTAAQILQAIDDWGKDSSNYMSGESGKLWDILTALRGPDDGNEELKLETTCIIRGYVLPNLTNGNALLVSTDRPHNVLLSIHQRDFLQGNSHFIQHIRSAVDAIKPLQKKVEQLIHEKKNQSSQNISSPQTHS